MTSDRFVARAWKALRPTLGRAALVIIQLTAVLGVLYAVIIAIITPRWWWIVIAVVAVVIARFVDNLIDEHNHSLDNEPVRTRLHREDDL
jgi:hypothetical protein